MCSSIASSWARRRDESDASGGGAGSSACKPADDAVRSRAVPGRSAISSSAGTCSDLQHILPRNRNAPDRLVVPLPAGDCFGEIRRPIFGARSRGTSSCTGVGEGPVVRLRCDNVRPRIDRKWNIRTTARRQSRPERFLPCAEQLRRDFACSTTPPHSRTTTGERPRCRDIPRA